MKIASFAKTTTLVKEAGAISRAALYLRVSSKDQTVENQERELRKWAERQGLEVVKVWVDTASPVWDLLLAVFAWVAQQERQRIGERVRAGQARARAQGVRFGRKPRLVDLEELCRRREAGQGWRRIARAMKAPTSTLRRKWEECQKSPAAMTHAHARLAGVSEAAEGEAGG